MGLEDSNMMEKRGVISDEDTPCCGDGGGDGSGCACHEPATKEAADQMESHLANDLIDAVADRTRQNH